MTMHYGEVRARPEDLEAFAEPSATPRPKLPRRINLDPEQVERGLTQLILSLVELVRRLMEKQALRRIAGGSLTTPQIERLGTTLMRLEAQMAELKEHFQVENLDIDLGPLGNLLDEHEQGGAL
jgi:gas vesicle protein GvpK